MTPSFRSILITILALVGYQNDKEKYADELIRLSIEKTISELSYAYPVLNQSQIIQKFYSIKDFTIFEETIINLTSKADYFNTLKKVFVESLKNTVTSVLPALSDRKKKELYNYIKSTEYSLR